MKYDKVKETEDSAESDQDVSESLLHGETSSPRKTRRLGYFLWVLLAENALFALALLAFWKAFVPSPTNLHYQVLTKDNKTYPSGPLSWSQHFEALPCGKTPDEARARGCEFDMLVTAWLPPRCIDRELVDEFMDVGKWQFYTRLHGTEEDKYSSYDPDFLGSVNTTIYTSRSWHVTHCFYMFKKLSRALVSGRTVDAEAVSEPHTEHCMKTMLNQLKYGSILDPDEIDTYLEIIYPPC